MTSFVSKDSDDITKVWELCKDPKCKGPASGHYHWRRISLDDYGGWGRRIDVSKLPLSQQSTQSQPRETSTVDTPREPAPYVWQSADQRGRYNKGFAFEKPKKWRKRYTAKKLWIKGQTSMKSFLKRKQVVPKDRSE